MSPFCGLVSLKQTLKNVHIIFNRGFALTRIKQALFLLQNIIFWVVLQHDWRGPWHKEWNGGLGAASHKCHPHLPLPSRPSLTPTRPCTRASVQLRHTGRHCRRCWIRPYPEETHWDVFRSYRNHWYIFQQRSATFPLSLELLPSAIIFPPSLQCLWECLSFRFFSLHEERGFQLIAHDRPSHSLHQHSSLQVIAPPQKGWVAEVGLAMRQWKKFAVHSCLHTKSLHPEDVPLGDLHASGGAHGRFPEHPSHRFTRLGRTGHETQICSNMCLCCLPILLNHCSLPCIS